MSQIFTRQVADTSWVDLMLSDTNEGWQSSVGQVPRASTEDTWSNATTDQRLLWLRLGYPGSTKQHGGSWGCSTFWLHQASLESQALVGLPWLLATPQRQEHCSTQRQPDPLVCVQDLHSSCRIHLWSGSKDCDARSIHLLFLQVLFHHGAHLDHRVQRAQALHWIVRTHTTAGTKLQGILPGANRIRQGGNLFERTEKNKNNKH